MSKILSIAWKDTIIRFSSRSEILFFLILPIVFTFILGGGNFGDADAAIPLLVVDEDDSALSTEFIALLDDSGVVDSLLLTAVEADEQFADEAAPALLTIPAGFEADLLQGSSVALDLQKAPNNTNAEAVERAVLAVMSAVGRTLIVAGNSVTEAERLQPFASTADKETYFSQARQLAQSEFEARPERLEVVQAVPQEEEDPFDLAAHQSAGQLITWVLIPLLGTSGFLAYERSKGTLRRLVTTPTTRTTFLLGTITGQFTAGVVQMLLLVGFGIVVMGVDWGDPAGLVVLLLAFGLASVSFGTMLGTFVKTDSQASNISIMAGMSMALLGGCWFPGELFPETVRTVTMVLPTTWAMQGLTDLTRYKLGLGDVLLEAGVLLGFAVLFLVIGARRFRYE